MTLKVGDEVVLTPGARSGALPQYLGPSVATVTSVTDEGVYVDVEYESGEEEYTTVNVFAVPLDAETHTHPSVYHGHVYETQKDYDARVKEEAKAATAAAKEAAKETK